MDTYKLIPEVYKRIKNNKIEKIFRARQKDLIAMGKKQIDNPTLLISANHCGNTAYMGSHI